MKSITDKLASIGIFIAIMLVSSTLFVSVIGFEAAKAEARGEQLIKADAVRAKVVHADELIVGDKELQLRVKKVGHTISMKVLDNAFEGRLNPEEMPRIEILYSQTDGPKLILRNGEKHGNKQIIQLHVSPTGSTHVRGVK